MKWQSLFSTRTLQMRRSAVRELLKVLGRPGMISFAGGIPAPELFPLDETNHAAAAVLQRSGREALQYGETEGLADLRDWVAARHSRPNLPIHRENVMIVTGSQQALDLIGKIFLDPGDRVLVENPTYLAALLAWRPFSPDFIPLQSDADGICSGEISDLEAKNAKLLYVVPNFQNPQGTSLSDERRRELLARTRERMAIVEDNPYGELRYSGKEFQHLLTLDAQGNRSSESSVIHLGTFSKILAPGFRVGWVIAAQAVIEKLVAAKQAADLHTSTFCQHVVLELVRNGVLERHIPTLCREYRIRRDAMLAALYENFPDDCTWTRPHGGMFLLVTLPPDINSNHLLARALDQDVAFVPGEHFHLDGSGANTFRLNFSNATPDRIEEGVKRLARELATMRESR